MNYNFNEEFYPTPKSLLNKIFDGVDWKQVDTILEPSAGKGDIIEFIQNSEEAHGFKCRSLYYCLHFNSAFRNFNPEACRNAKWDAG